MATLAVLSAVACRPSQPSLPPSSDGDTTGTQDAPAPDLARDEVLEPRRLACAVLAANPGLAAWRESWRAASARADQPTPVGEFSIAYSFAPGSIGSNVVRYGQVVEIAQSFRLGQARLERRVARAEAEVAEHDYAAERQQLVLASTDLFDQYYTLTRALESNAEHRDLVAALLETATARYATGYASQQDPLQADLELAQIERERVALESQRDVVAAQINGLLHRAPDAALPPPPDVLAPAPVDDEPDARPETEAAQAREQAAQEAETLARRRYAPSLKAMGSYNSMWARIEHQFMVGVGIAIPIQVRSLRAGVDEARASRAAARYRREAVDDAVAVERAAARRRYDEAREVVAIHRERLIPTARARIDAARVGYETGANDFSTVIDAERDLRRVELDLHRATAELNDARAELEYALGRRPDCDDGGRRR